jgi:hypothetical protein
MAGALWHKGPGDLGGESAMHWIRPALQSCEISNGLCMWKADKTSDC